MNLREIRQRAFTLIELLLLKMRRKPKRIFTLSTNNKGLWCPFKAVLCQEGYCSECQIYLDWQKLAEIVLICAWCGKVIDRKPNSFGRPVVSHGICPECQAKYFPKPRVGTDR